MSNIERRFFKSELRASTKAGQRIIEGYAAKFGKSIRPEMQRMLGFNERCAPGCFSRSIRSGADVLCLRDHDKHQLMGRVANNTLTLSEDNTGLNFRCALPETQAARDLHALINRADISACSFGFVVPDGGDKWTKEKNDNGQLQATRTLTDIDLLDVSAVCDPAYLDTEVNSRDEDDDDDADAGIDDPNWYEENSLQEVERNAIVRALFPHGIPAEVRSHMQWRRRPSGIVTPNELELMKMRVALALRD